MNRQQILKKFNRFRITIFDKGGSVSVVLKHHAYSSTSCMVTVVKKGDKWIIDSTRHFHKYSLHYAFFIASAYVHDYIWSDKESLEFINYEYPSVKIDKTYKEKRYKFKGVTPYTVKEVDLVGLKWKLQSRDKVKINIYG